MGGLLWNIGAFIVALGLLVAVHEFGHFWVARRCGVKVERFSIGFGKAIWRRLGKDGTEYVLALIPLGGYVKMLDGRVDELKPGEEAQAFNHKSVWARMAIVAAGPMANFVFALFAFWLMFMIGVPSVGVSKPIAPARSRLTTKASRTSLGTASGVTLAVFETAPVPATFVARTLQLAYVLPFASPVSHSGEPLPVTVFWLPGGQRSV